MDKLAQVPTPHPILGYSVNRESFEATHFSVTISVDERGAGRELRVTTKPQSPAIKRAFGSLDFRIIEDQLTRTTDADGKPIVGGLNYDPVHVVLSVTPASIDMLHLRLSVGRKLVISICPASNMLEWNQEESLLIYEATFIA